MNTKDRRKERIEARAFLKAAGKQAEVAALIERAERVEERAGEIKGKQSRELFTLGASLRKMAREMEKKSVRARKALETLSGMEYEVMWARYAEGRSWNEAARKLNNTREGLAYYERAAVDRLIDSRMIKPGQNTREPTVRTPSLRNGSGEGANTGDKLGSEHREKNKK